MKSIICWMAAVASCLSLCVKEAAASVQFCNAAPFKIFAAIAYYPENSSEIFERTGDLVEIVTGWFPLQSKECAIVLDGNFSGENYEASAISEDGRTAWGGDDKVDRQCDLIQDSDSKIACELNLLKQSGLTQIHCIKWESFQYDREQDLMSSAEELMAGAGHCKSGWTPWAFGTVMRNDNNPYLHKMLRDGGFYSSSSSSGSGDKTYDISPAGLTHRFVFIF